MYFLSVLGKPCFLEYNSRGCNQLRISYLADKGLSYFIFAIYKLTDYKELKRKGKLFCGPHLKYFINETAIFFLAKSRSARCQREI